MPIAHNAYDENSEVLCTQCKYSGILGKIQYLLCFSLLKTKLIEQLLSAQSEHKPNRSAPYRADGLTNCVSTQHSIVLCEQLQTPSD